MIIKHMIIVALLSLQAAQPSSAMAAPQDRDKVNEAVELFRNKQYDKSMSLLRDLGERGIPAALNLLQSEEVPVGVPMFRLLGFISSIESETANKALIELLSAKGAFLRGQSASELGRRKNKVAIPNLIQLLNDKEIYLTTTITDPYREEHTLVRDVAIDALEAIANRKLKEHSGYEEKAKAWVRWWNQQKTN